MNTGKKEKRFLDALSTLFTGAEVDGESGFIDLMRIKKQYFDSISPKLMVAIDARVGSGDEREELFDKLWTFFRHYFCESGSIYFRHLSAFSKTYDRVYADGQDVALSWKTQMLYYVKSDVLVKSMQVELTEDGRALRFYFNADGIEHKKNNEKKEFVFAFDDVKGKEGDETLHLSVSYAKNGSVTKTDDIIKAAKKQKFRLAEEDLQKAIAAFRRQTEVDFFINKDARAFLCEQFDLWLYEYMFDKKSIFDEKRIRQLQAIKDTAYDIIAFIAQFEDELCRIWEKPKFVRGVNYVVTLDRLSEKTLKKVIKSKGAKAQVAEWQQLGMVDEQFTMDKIFNGQKSLDSKNGTAVNRKFLPLDTKHFKELELDILNELGDLDESLDGELVHSENWQALNTLKNRYHEKAKCVYLDPPYNTGQDFDYRDSFQDGSWLTLMGNRLEIAKAFLNESGHVYLQLDHYADYLGRILLQNIFPNVKKGDQTVITWNTGENISGFKTQRDNWIRQADKILFFPKDPENADFVKLWLPVAKHMDKRVGWLDFIGGDKDDLYIEKWRDDKICKVAKNIHAKRIGNIWNDIYSFQYSEPRETESFSFETQKPENLLRRIIQSCTHANDVVVDIFAGTGTTPATALKLGRKWLAVEFEKHFHDFYNGAGKKVGILGRLKIVLSGDKEFSLPNTTQKRTPHLTKDVNWAGGGFFKYYALEQYEETLTNLRYKQKGELMEADDQKSPFEQYVFFADKKLSHGTFKDGKLDIDLSKLYPDIDIGESLANVLGKTIRRRDADSVTFADGSVEKINPANMTEKERRHFAALIKPYLWWGE